MIRKIRFLAIISIGLLCSSTHAIIKPVGEITYTYKDTLGQHKTQYQALPKGSLDAIKKIAFKSKWQSRLGLAGSVVGVIGTSFITLLAMSLSIWDGGDKIADEAKVAIALSGGATFAAMAAARKGSLNSTYARRMLSNHIAQSKLPTSRLPLQLRNGQFDWFVASHETKPIQASIPEIKN